MFNFHKHRQNTERLDEIPDIQCLGRLFRVGGELPKEPSVVVVAPCHSLDLEAQIAHRVHQRLNTIMIVDSGSSTGVSLHSDDLSEVLKAEIKPLDISEMLGRNKTQR